MNCTVDQECPGLEMCYYEEYNWVGDENICGCNNWFGYIGSDCTTWGVGTYVIFFSVLFSGALGLVGVSYGFYTLLLVFKVSERLENRRQRRRARSSTLSDLGSAPGEDLRERKLTGRTGRTGRTPMPSTRAPTDTKSCFNVLNTTALLAFLGMFFFLTFRVSQLVIILTPTNLSTREESGIDGRAKTHFQEKNVDPILITLTGVFMSLSVMNLSLVWIDNVRKIQTFTVQNTQRVIRYKFFLGFLNFAWILIASLLEPAEVTPIIIFLLIIAAISYIVAVYYLKKLQKTFNKDLGVGGLNENRTSFTSRNYWLDILVNRMVLARRRIVIGTILAVLGGLFYAVTSLGNSWREYSPTGYPSPPMLGNEVLIFALGFIQFAVIYFLYSSAKRPVSKSNQRSKARKKTSFFISKRKQSKTSEI